MQSLLEVILPVFLLIGFGYVAVWRRLFSNEAVEGLMIFAQNFAVPCLLFRAISTLDLGATFAPALLLSFYLGASVAFVVGLLGARMLFRRPWEDSVAIGFCTLFSNSLLLGLPITERAYGADALGPNFAIVALHAPFCYVVGLTAMELVRARRTGSGGTGRTILASVFRNPMVVAVLAGFALNVSGLALPTVVAEAVDMIASAAIPAALFGLGGVLYRYRPEGDALTIAFVAGVSLVLHPAIVFGLGRLLALDPGELRSAVITASMAPGVNAYIFANLYGVARRVAASSVLVSTVASVVTVWLWLAVLP